MFKDAVLDALADRANVAQFVSFGPDIQQRHSCVRGYAKNHAFSTMMEAISSLLAASPDGSVNVRSFKPDSPQGNAFHYGLRSASEAVAHAESLTASGLYVIVNETVDVNDGGVSGVLFGGCVEFAPGQVPRFVEKDNANPVPAMPATIAMRMLETVYGFPVGLVGYTGRRVEFSIHPKARGWMKSHVIVWEDGEDSAVVTPFFSWPNPFSQMIGDKAYGLLVAHLLGFPVPRTVVFPRTPKVGAFAFGEPTGAAKVWTRTAPRVQEPGKYTTVRGWLDPHALMHADDPQGRAIASCLIQDEVASQYSGALLTGSDGVQILDAVTGFGDAFMVGSDAPVCDVPESVAYDVRTLHEDLCRALGPVRFEWAHDGERAWVLQLHKGASESCGRVVYPGDAAEWVNFVPADGLQALREIAARAKSCGHGVVVAGNVGMSSHICDVLRKARVPSVLAGVTKEAR